MLNNKEVDFNKKINLTSAEGAKTIAQVVFGGAIIIAVSWYVRANYPDYSRHTLIGVVVIVYGSRYLLSRIKDKND